MQILLLILFSLLTAFASDSIMGKVRFQSGYAIVNGNPVRALTHLYVDTLIVCSPQCIIESGGKTLILDVKGFGTFLSMSSLAKKTSEAQSFAQSTQARPEASPEEKPVSEDQSLPEEETLKKGETVEAEDLELASLSGIKLPYPKEDTLFFHRRGGLIFIVARKICESDCSLAVWSMAGNATRYKFEKGEKPVVRLEVGVDSVGQVTWEFEDGEVHFSHRFEIKKQGQDPEAFSNALKTGRPVEFMH